MKEPNTNPAAVLSSEPSFEGNLGQLEETLARLEEGGLTLDESIVLFEQGMRLAQACKQLLDRAELRVTQLKVEFSDGN